MATIKCKKRITYRNLSNSTKSHREHPVQIEEGKAGLKKNSMVNLAQILTIDKGRLIKKLGKLEENRIQEVDEAIKLSLGLKDDEVQS